MNNPRRIKMVFDLKLFGEPSQTPEHVTTCIEAMRGWGRTHTTRNFQPSQAWKIQAGDIAIAVGGRGEEVAFRVGEEYRISIEMAENARYQQRWASQEKHSGQYLKQLIRKNPIDLWGLPMEPLGDWVNGEITPFPVQSENYLPTRAELLDWYIFVKTVGAKIDPEAAAQRMQQIQSLGDTLRSAYNGEGEQLDAAPPLHYRHASVMISNAEYFKMQNSVNYIREQRAESAQLELNGPTVRRCHSGGETRWIYSVAWRSQVPISGHRDFYRDPARRIAVHSQTIRGNVVP